MSRARERYICASEDRPHYNNEVDYCTPYRYPGPPPHVVTFIQESIIREEISEDRLNEIIDARIPQITETVINEIGDTIVTTENVDAAIDEIYGGAAPKEGDGE